MNTPAPIHTLPLSRALIRELRSDHAGEAGAVQIYHGILAVSRDQTVREFARQHLVTEQRHLAFFDAWLSPQARSHALPLWRLCGWVLGAGAALGGADHVFRTIAAVEQFVDGHYRDQVRAMRHEPRLDELRGILESFREDEVHHRDDARERTAGGRSLPGRCWDWLIDSGSRAGVVLAKRL
jgi:ubiquinone biosynthesis monooxygenase Coq7